MDIRMPGPGIFLKSGMPLISGVSGDVFRHCVRAFLLFSSTFCVHFYYFPALFSVRISTVFSTVGVHFYYVAALFACISAVFVCVCMCVFVFLNKILKLLLGKRWPTLSFSCQKQEKCLLLFRSRRAKSIHCDHF